MKHLDPELSHATVLYLRFGSSSHPVRNPDGLTKEFGPSKGSELISQVRALVDESDGINIDWTKHSLKSARDEVLRIMRERHPELTDEAIQALAWRFSFVNR
jgi:hypothetical protein